jgi:NTE family protein
MRRGLVLAGGYVAGVAWELGVLRGFQDLDGDLLAATIAADVVVGTSAGATVAAQITSGTPLDDLFVMQLTTKSSEIEVDVDLSELMERFAEVAAGADSSTEVRRRIGELALATVTTVDEATYRASRAARLPVSTWPTRNVYLPAVDADTGSLTVFDGESGVGLAEAVAASSAFPCVWPTVTIGKQRYIDGAIHSLTNTHLAVGCDRVLVLLPAASNSRQPFGSLEAEIKQLEPSDVRVIYADEDSIAAFGTSPLSPSTSAPAARAGRLLGRTLASDLEWFAR